jgi:hypothetical protein
MLPHYSTGVGFVMKKGRPRKVTDQEIALAMELRSEGCEWKVIAKGLGHPWESLRCAVRKAKEKINEQIIPRV